jgi:hypothetical protein
VCTYVKGVRWSMFFEERAVTNLIVVFELKHREKGGFDGVDSLFSDCCCFRREKGFSDV